MFCKATLGEDAEGGFVFLGGGEGVVSAWRWGSGLIFLVLLWGAWFVFVGWLVACGEQG